jgi:RNA polymerase sigma-70 factor, ECF subfamily
MLPVHSDPREEELLKIAASARDGDLRAFESLVNHFQKSVRANCQYLTHDPAISEDLAQEVFVKAYFGLRTFEGRSSVRHWLNRIKVNHCLNYIRQQQVADELPIEDEAPTPTHLQTPPLAEREMEVEAERQRISRVLRALPEVLRIPLVMRDMDELSYEEISATLRIGLSAAKMRVKRGRERFRTEFERKGGVR